MFVKLRVPYDIIDNIISYVDIKTSKELLISCSYIYYIYRHSKYFNSIFIQKICNYFTSLKKIDITLFKKYQDKTSLYKILNQIFNMYKNHKNVSLSELLVYVCHNDTSCNEFIFNVIISNCYYLSKQHKEHAYNHIKTDDLIYLLLFKKNVKTITNYIQIDPVILVQVIKNKIMLHNTTNIFFLINYLLYKYFFKYSSFIQESISDIICELICSSNFSINYNILIKIYDKYNKYKFILNYQKIINACMRQSHTEYIDLIHNKMIEQKKIIKLDENDIYPIVISKDYIRNLLKNKHYLMLDKIIELFLGDKINMYIYFNEIYNNFDTSTRNCNSLFKYLTNENKLKLLHM